MKTKPECEFRTIGGALKIGGIPRVVGTLSSFPDDFAPLSSDVPSDIVEVRLDEMPGQNDWLDRCSAIEAGDLPVILTLRLASEGGKWTKRDEDRLPIFQKALENLSAVDVEFESKIATNVAEMARAQQKACIVSYHDFDGTPSLEELNLVLTRAQSLASVVKISTMVRGETDIKTLLALLQQSWNVPVCVIGMGSEGVQTRVAFPTLGSCMTYGYLDKPSAPGQLPARTLVSQLRQILPRYNEDVVSRKQILEYA